MIATVEDALRDVDVLLCASAMDPPTAEVLAEVAEQTRLADELGYAIAWFAEHHFSSTISRAPFLEHHFSNYCLCASPLMMVAHCASMANRARFRHVGRRAS
jgi:alkanesulfonate monooxygenase SsuD/methylene tetrahydromethanopterin reductase-like flavin-dependent oxidoreductase (luciferase family)